MNSHPSLSSHPQRRISVRLGVLAWLVWVVTAALAGAAESEVLSLQGTWRLALDREDAGLRDHWHERALGGRIRLPGSLPGQGIGDPVTTNTPWVGGIVDRSWFTAPEFEPYRQPGQVKVPFWLQPETVYVGPAWYQREVEIPRSWADRRVVLFLERPHWQTTVWLDDRRIGVEDALGTPHEHVLGVVSPGRHRLTVRVDNRMVIDIGENSHSMSDHTQGNWNGIVGRIELQAMPLTWVDEVQAYPLWQEKSARVRATLATVLGGRVEGRLVFQLRRAGSSRVLQEKRSSVEFADRADYTADLELGADAVTWDEFSPQRYVISVDWEPVEGPGHGRRVPFGLRQFEARGTQFFVNERPVFLRGTLECSIFPRTGHPPTDVEAWRRVMRTAQAHGLNHLRFHSHCPPEAAFEAADELGVYLHVEASSWANQSTTLGDGKPVDAWIYAETDRILRHYGNHPSFVLMPYGNEPAGANHQAYLAQWVTHFKARDPRRLWSSGAGWPQLPVNQWHSSPDPRIYAWGDGLKARINARPPETMTDYRAYIAARPVPVVSHEIGEWCVYPNFDEMRKYTGYLKPRNFEIFQDRLAASGQGHLARRFLYASGRLQTLCYKEDIESALRTPGMGGFQLLDLHDFPGQGTALVGVLDPFWEEKGYVSPAEFRRFCAPTVPLARLQRRVFTQSERFEAEIEVAHFGPSERDGVQVGWALRDDRGRTAASGVFPPVRLRVGNGQRIGHVAVDLATVPAPARYRLVATVPGRPAAENDWDVWVYPSLAPTAAPHGLRVTRDLDDAAAAELEQGGRVLWLVPPGQVKPDVRTGPVALGFSSIFWNTAWTGRQAPHTLGILCDPRHPALAAFPTEAFSNWQWWYLVSQAGAMILNELPPDLEPTVRVIDDWVTARRLALAFEAQVGKGRLFVCSIDLADESALDVVRRQFRSSLMEYLDSDRFRPATRLTVEQARWVAR